jgi:hypothetical protein
MQICKQYTDLHIFLCKGKSMELQSPPSPREKTTIIQKIENHFEKDGQELTNLLRPVENKTEHLEELISKKIDEKTLPFEEDFIDKILRNPNTEKLVEYIANHPNTQKIVKDIAEKEAKNMQEDVAKKLESLENNFSQDFQYIGNIVYAFVGVAITATVLIAAYAAY